MLDQPGGKRVHLCDDARLRSMPPLGPAAHLAFDEPNRFPQLDEPCRFEVDGVKVGEGVDKSSADAAAHVGSILYLPRLLVAHHNAMASFHHIENRADDGGVLAEQVR